MVVVVVISRMGSKIRLTMKKNKINPISVNEATYQDVKSEKENRKIFMYDKAIAALARVVL